MTTPDPAITGMTTDTDPDNPVNAYPADVFPIGAALTVAFGSNERPFCTLGNLYRVVGYLTGDIPMADGLASAIQRCRQHVLQQLPTELRVMDPPPEPSDVDNTADMVYVGGITNKYGATIKLVALPGTPFGAPIPTDTEGSDTNA